jgi:hypothetical protein
MSSWSHRIAVFCLALTSAFSAVAQTFQIDVAIRFEPSAPLPWLLNSPYQLRLYVSNLSGRPTRGLIRQRILVPGLVDAYEFLGDSCRRTAECENFGFLCFDTPTIPTGGEAVCTINVIPRVLRGQSFFARYTYQDIVSDHFETNLSNNSVDVLIPLIDPAKATQLPLSPWTYAALILLVIGVGATAARRWS